MSLMTEISHFSCIQSNLQFNYIFMDSQALVLFSFDFIQTAYVSEADPNIHLVLQESSPGTLKVIKNAKNLSSLFEMFQYLKLPMICYTNKNYRAVYPIISRINKNISWVYINIDRNRLHQLKPNYSILSKSNQGVWLIEYGDNLSNTQGKQQARIAVASAFQISQQDSKRRMIFFENNPKQIAKLKQNQYQNIISNIDDFDKQSFLKRLQSICQNSQNQQMNSFLSSAPSFDSLYLKRIYNFSYLANRKSIVPSIGLGVGTKIPLFRLPNSHAISNMVFKYLSDKQIYYGDCQLPAKIGGDLYHEQQENKILLSSIYQTLRGIQQKQKIEDYNFLCTPMFISQFMMKNCLISAYNKNKGYFIVKPYVKNCITIEQMLSKIHKQQQAIELLRTGQIKGAELRGLGHLLAVSLVCGEQLIQKGLFSTILICEVSKNKFNCCRSDILNCFRKIKQKQKEGIVIKVLSCPQTYFKIEDLNERYISQIKESLSLMIKNFPFIQSTFKHHIWHFNKVNSLQFLKKQLFYFANQFKVLNGQDFNLSKMQLEQMKANMFLTLIGKQDNQNYQYFTEVKNDPDTQLFYSGQNKNPYQEKILGLQNFIIYGQCVPVLTLIRWIKQKKSQLDIIYISLLKQKVQNYLKHIKLAKSEKKNVMFIVDHCELEQLGEQDHQKSIVETNWGIKTIFIFRLKISQSKKLYILHDTLTAATTDFSIINSKLEDSRQETFKTMFYYYSKQSKKERFQTYYEAIRLYIDSKLCSFGLKNILSIGKLLEFLKNLTKSINVKNNRLLTILKQKQFNPLLFFQTEHLQMLDTQQSEKLGQTQEKKQCYLHLKNVPSSQVILYCLPIYICNQKVWLLHDIHEFFNAFALSQKIKQSRWDGSFQGQQLKHFLTWYPQMRDNQQIEDSLIKTLDIFQRESIQKKGENYVMGGSNKVNDCLQLLKRIGVENLFCKLEQIFYIDSPAVQMIQVSKGGKLIITAKGSLYKSVVEVGQQCKKQNILKLIDKQKEDDKIYLGASCFFYEQNAFHLYYAEKQKDLADRRICKLSMKEGKVYEKQLKFDFFGGQECKKEKEIVRMEIVEQKYCLILFSDLHLLIGHIDLQSQMKVLIIREQNINELFGVRQGKKQLKNNQNSLLISFSYLKQESSCRFVIALSNKFMKLQNSQQSSAEVASPKILLVSYLIQQLKKDFHAIQERNLSIISLDGALASLSLKIAEFPIGNVQIMAFYQESTTLMIWRLEKKDKKDKIEQSIVEVNEVQHKYYRVEPDSNRVFKFGECFYVSSKYGFVKKMKHGAKK